ncbi:hypothetical protein D8B26_007788 [Coccidioides posadasii str. Silveira]|uniref:Uncharacterized protein n=1 Tax=Coccidioides posadasii (strain RMSCC 757 / Silveira) TaxID=443226 RepID=E9D1A5_COCPS|nr:conserved hypothetical protein [Coccidioides posadasii str. Silveira]QVM13172.1 hypothetical protein D8B26_007788 [Coccidioides posadasii str. Silveira]
MGGKVFSEPRGDQAALRTPRMSEAVYIRTRDFCIDKLRQSFEVVVAPPEAPGKLDYGDVDTLVQGLRPGFTWEEVGKRLNSVRTVRNGETRSFAVPIVCSDGDGDDGEEDTYAQVDVHVCRPGFMEWECLLDSYGDMWKIVGKFMRPLGLTATDKGLHVRIAEIEPFNRAYSMVYLTHSPMDVLDFVGLDVERYQRGFKTLDELYGWCASAKYFHRDAHSSGLETSNDRQRKRKRPMYRNFVDEWIPRNAELWQDKKPASREDVVQQALLRFGKQAEYKERVTAWRYKREEEELWSEVGCVIAEECSTNVNIVLRGLKRWVRFTNGDGDGRSANDEPVRLVLRTEAEMDPDRQPRWASQISHELGDNPLSKAELLEWVRKHWQEVKVLEKGRVAAAKAARR